MATIICDECGALRENCPKNTRLCRECRTVQQLKFEFDSLLTKKANSPTETPQPFTKQCLVCENDHTPYRRDARMCADCYAAINLTYKLAETCPCCRKTPEDRAALGQSPGVALFLDNPICNYCFDNPDFKFRRSVLKFMVQRQADRKDHYKENPVDPALEDRTAKPRGAARPSS